MDDNSLVLFFNYFVEMNEIFWLTYIWYKYAFYGPF